MPLQSTGTTQTGTSDTDILFGVEGTDSIQNGGDGNDFIIGDYGNIFTSPSGNNSIANAFSLDDSNLWYTVPNPLVFDNGVTPYTTVYLEGEGETEFFAVTVGAGETLTVDTDFNSFDSILEIFDASGVSLAVNDDGDHPGDTRGNFTVFGFDVSSFVTYTNTSSTTEVLYIEVTDFTTNSITAGTESLLLVSVSNHAATGDPADFAAGNDVLDGGAGDDQLFGMDGDDTLEGGAGDDLIEGGAGADTLDGGDGDDTLSYVGSTAGVSVNVLGNAASNGDAEGDIISNFENIIGSDFNDVLVASGLVAGGLGNDILQGGGLTYILDGGLGDDLIFVQSNAVTSGASFDGGDGIDIIRFFGPSATFDLRTDSITNIETLTLSVNAASAVTVIELEATQFANSGIMTVEILGAHAGGGGQLSLFLDTETTLDLSQVTFTNFAEAGDLVQITGDADNETIIGSSVRDIVDAGAGDDLIEGGAGADTLDGGDGNDTLSYAASTAGVSVDLETNIVSGGDAEGDIISNFENVTGSDFDDTIVIDGSGTANIVNAGGGDDTIQRNGSTNSGTLDLIDGGTGVNTLITTGFGLNQTIDLLGGEILFLGDSRDQLTNIQNVTVNSAAAVIGDADANVIIGLGAFDNTFEGGAGDDIIEGGAGADMIDGGDGNDIIVAGGSDLLDGVDIVNGGAGNDTITGGFFTDIVNGDAGDDRFIFLENHRIDIIDGGADNDTLDFSGYFAIDTNGAVFDWVVDLSAGTYTRNVIATSQTIQNVENVEAGDGNDQLIGDANSNILSGGAGDDLIEGGAGDDLIEGGAGADTLDGGDGNDTLSYAASTAGVSVDLETNIVSGGDAEGDIISNFENVTGSDFDDTIVIDGTGSANNVNAGGGNDTIHRNGGTLSSVINVIDGGTGVNTLITTGFDFNQTIDLLGGEIHFNGASRDVLTNIQNVTVNSAATVIGDAGANVIVGLGDHDNTFEGGAGDDTIDGGAGTDTLIGGDGNDIFLVQAASDFEDLAEIIDGGDGFDRLVLNEVTGPLDAADLGSVSDVEALVVGGSHDDSITLDADYHSANGGLELDDALLLSEELYDGFFGLFAFSNFTNSSNGLSFLVSQGFVAAQSNAVGVFEGGVNGGFTLDASDFILQQDAFVFVNADGGNTDITTGSGADIIILSSQASLDLTTATGTISVNGGAFADAGDENILVLQTNGLNSAHVLGDAVQNIDRVVLEFGIHFDATIVLDSSFSGDNLIFDGRGIDGFGDRLFFDGSANAFNESLTVFGASSSDVLSTGAGQDEIFAGAGNDTLSGGGGADILDGGDGTDTASYATSTNRVIIDLAAGTAASGHAIGDTLTSIENLIGSDFGDIFTGDASVNVFTGGTGNDDIDGGDGIDTVNFSGVFSNYTLTENMDGSFTVTDNVGSEGTDTLTNIEFAQFGGGLVDLSDLPVELTITGTEMGETLQGGLLNDTISGLGGNDFIIGDQGADTLNGGSGDDTFQIDTNDIVVGAEVIDGGSETVRDRIQIFGAGGDIFDLRGSTLLSIEEIEFSINSSDGFRLLQIDSSQISAAGLADDLLIDGSDGFDGGLNQEGIEVHLDTTSLDLSGWTFQDWGTTAISQTDSEVINIFGSRFSDTITGSSERDVIEGANGNDVIVAGAGDDILIGGGGGDTLDGGDGVDTASYVGSTNRVEVSLLNGTGASGQATNDVLMNIENLLGSDFADEFRGTNGDNELDGGNGNDILIGFDGDDVLLGGAGRDIINGGDGADTIDGGEGADQARYNGSSEGVQIDLLNGTASGGQAEGDTLTGIESLFGSAHTDILAGDGENNRLFGFNGDDTLIGNGGVNRLNGGSGEDTFVLSDGFSFVLDFVDDVDQLDVSDYGFTSLSDALMNLEQVGAHARFRVGDDVLFVLNTDVDDLMDDIIFDDGSVV